MIGSEALRSPWRYSACVAGQPLGPRRADVVLVQHVERRRAHEPQQHRALRQGERDRRQHQRLDRRGRDRPTRRGGKPCAGNRFQWTPNTMISSRPAQNVGTAMPSWLTTDRPMPSARRWRAPAMMPSGTATSTDSTVDASTSGAVTAELRAELAGDRLAVERRRAEVARAASPPTQSRYWRTSGRSSPSSSRIASMRSGDASVPPMTRARSPGSSRSSSEDDDAGDDDGHEQQPEAPQHVQRHARSCQPTGGAASRRRSRRR